MARSTRNPETDGPMLDDEQKAVALDRILDAWDDALGEGCDPDQIATAAIFAALTDMIDAYGEELVADMAQSLPKRIRDGEFSMRDVETH